MLTLKRDGGAIVINATSWPNNKTFKNKNKNQVEGWAQTTKRRILARDRLVPDPVPPEAGSLRPIHYLFNYPPGQTDQLIHCIFF